MADYGTANGLKNRFKEYDAWVTASELTQDMIDEAYDDAQGQIDRELCKITVPPMTAPAWAMKFINKIADDLAACAVLTQYYINKAPDESQELVRFCDKPLEALKEFVADVEKNPALLDPTVTQGDNLILSNTYGYDRTFTVTQKINGTVSGDEGTTEDW